MKNQKHTSQRGITLIALIITIIVMLILVGVTVNVALTGGLFTKASEASKQMQVEAEKEELLSSVVAAIGYDGKVDLGEIQLPNGWTGTNGTYTSPKGNAYTVDENGKIESGESNNKEKTFTLDVVQIDKGCYSDYATLDIRVLYDNDEIVYDILEKYFQIEFENNLSLEENALKLYNDNINDPYNNDNNMKYYTSIEETGFTLKELLIELFGEEDSDWEMIENVAAEVMVHYFSTVKIVTPDKTISGNMEDELEGIDWVDSDERKGVFNYIATQLGTYEITITYEGISMTDTITITEF